jgi:hypothetical protein
MRIRRAFEWTGANIRSWSPLLSAGGPRRADRRNDLTGRIDELGSTPPALQNPKSSCSLVASLEFELPQWWPFQTDHLVWEESLSFCPY